MQMTKLELSSKSISVRSSEFVRLQYLALLVQLLKAKHAQSHERIKFPTIDNGILDVKHLLQSKNRFQLPTEIGVIDCIHVGILKPNHQGDAYINWKGKHTFIVQATCDAKQKFTNIDLYMMQGDVKIH